MRQNKTTWFYIGGSGLDCPDDFQKFCRSGLHRIQFYRNKTGLRPKNFTVRSSMVRDRGVQDQDFRTRIRQDSAHFEQTESDQDYGFVQVAGSGFSNFIFGI